MKAVISLILAISIMLICSSCALTELDIFSDNASNQEDNVWVGQTDSENGATIPDGVIKTDPDGESLNEKPDDPLSPEKIAAIPIANDSMTSEELRQICVDYLKLSVSCQWVADESFYLVDEESAERNFTQGKLYGGIPYVNEASGNLYRFMEYYDPETGTLDSQGICAKPELFATACSGTAGWAWSRVINSAEISWTHSINASHGFIPVGPYKYDFDMDQIWEWGEDGEKIYYYDTKKICKNNASQKMYESYALTHLADCYSRTGHVAMAVSEPVVVRNEDGTINGEESYIMLAEQGQYTKAKYHLRTTSDGTEYRIRGNDGRAFKFIDLYKAGYLVHTFAEFIGEDPVEAGSVTIEHTEATASAEDLAQGFLRANYPISDIFTTVYNSDGEIVYEHVERTVDHYTKVLAASDCIPCDDLRQYETGDYTVMITSQISNGELITVYTGVLVE